MNNYYRVEEEKVKGKVLNNGRDAWEELCSIPGVRATSWGGIFLPEDYVLSMETDPFGSWLAEQCAVLPFPYKEGELE